MGSPISSSAPVALPEPLLQGQSPSALAPMQDVTGLPFMRVVAACGPPDYFFTEYFRVHEHSRLEPKILSSITEYDSGRPVFAQLIGERHDDLRRTVRDLLPHPIAGIDLYMGCPAPGCTRKTLVADCCAISTTRTVSWVCSENAYPDSSPSRCGLGSMTTLVSMNFWD